MSIVGPSDDWAVNPGMFISNLLIICWFTGDSKAIAGVSDEFVSWGTKHSVAATNAQRDPGKLFHVQLCSIRATLAENKSQMTQLPAGGLPPLVKSKGHSSLSTNRNSCYISTGIFSCIPLSSAVQPLHCFF